MDDSLEFKYPEIYDINNLLAKCNNNYEII